MRKLDRIDFLLNHVNEPTDTAYRELDKINARGRRRGQTSESRIETIFQDDPDVTIERCSRKADMNGFDFTITYKGCRAHIQVKSSPTGIRNFIYCKMDRLHLSESEVWEWLTAHKLILVNAGPWQTDEQVKASIMERMERISGRCIM